MIKHVVMWRLKAEVEGGTKAENAREMKSRLEALPPRIQEIRRLEVGINISPSERSSDVVLTAEFDSPADLAAYSAHPAHQEVVAFIRGIAVETRVVDYPVSRDGPERPVGRAGLVVE